MEIENQQDQLETHFTKKNPLSQDEAKLRALLVRDLNGSYDIQYKTLLVLRRKADKSSTFATSNFDGRCEITFTFHKNDEHFLKAFDFFLNFIGEIKSYSVNGIQQQLNYYNQKINIEPNDLINNKKNTVVILFSGRYSHSGVGLHHYTDSSDNKEYLYTQFEPFDCNRVFPAFDQPDMKANMKLFVVAPNEWIVLSNEYEELSTRDQLISFQNPEILNNFNLNISTEETEFLFVGNQIDKKEYSLHEFINTDKISSYLYALCAGPYHKISCPYETEVPLNIYLRDSIKNFGKIPEFFQATIAGMKFYKSYFGIAYPFRKYDQIFCPEYNMGAMENVGLVTYNEYYCFKDTPTNQQMCNFLIVILHELAHMWFGNLVTMVWWDDLWLNESFATFISHLCLANTPELSEFAEMSWLIFNTCKGFAYTADQQSTTHPVMCEVKNTEIAETHFDEIVYEKGSSVLKQIFYLISNQEFSAGLKNYFQKYKWKNTTFPDFISEMSELEYCKNLKNSYNIEEELQQFCDNHLKKSGLNEVELDMEIKDGKIIKFDILQTPCLEAHSNRQTHLIDILFLNNFSDLSSEENITFKNIVIHSKQITSFEKFVGQNAPQVLILNYNDWGYFKWVIDRRSIDNLKDNLPLIQDNLVKVLVYRSLFDMLRDSKISGFEFFELFEKFLIAETSELTLPNHFRNLSSAISSYIPLRFFEKFSSQIFNIILGMLKKQLGLYNQKSADASKDLILTLIVRLISFSCAEEHYQLFVKWLENEAAIDEVIFEEGLISQDHKFSMIKKIYESRVIPLEKKENLLEIQIKNDKNSDRSVLAKNYCNAVRPERKNKEDLFNKFTKESKSDSLYNMEAMMAGFQPFSQRDIIEDFVKNKFFDVIGQVAKENDHFYLQTFVNNLSPFHYPEDDIIEKLEKVHEDNKANDVLSRYIRELIDDTKRKKKAYLLCEEYLRTKSQ